VVGVAAFVLAALVSAAARTHVPTLVLGPFFVAVVLAVARFGGVVYAVPVGLVSLYAFDWYFLLPLRDLDTATLVVLGVSIVTAVLVAEIASRAGRRADSSEEARGVLADEQTALRRVATLVALGPPPPEVFAAVAEEVGQLVSISGTRIIRYESDGTATVVAAWAKVVEPSVVHVGARLTLEGESVTALVSRTGRPARMDEYANPTGSIAKLLGEARIQSAVGAPIVVEGRLWGVMVAGSVQPEPLPVGTESRLAQFTELVAMAISNAEARRELERVAAEQAAVSRVATLVAEAVPSSEIFAAVATGIAGLFELPLAALFRFGQDRTATLIAASGDLSPAVLQSWSFPLDDPGVLASVLRTGRPARIDD
jgi:K+-sensing histidine kinase KdpD